jgi:hypothetical protein
MVVIRQMYHRGYRANLQSELIRFRFAQMGFEGFVNGSQPSISKTSEG